ncbi:ABC transporter ATP-binding protein [Desulfocurvibacter africanus]|uniref:ABC transporter ATP-binding protein n=1 Tax=Desulfocurvibacter africanus TaxID=873 RepID=UPI000429536F|nr:ATP-binding cassette domain-containing protein [Desulfocurvibacter africanus]
MLLDDRSSRQANIDLDAVPLEATGLVHDYGHGAAPTLRGLDVRAGRGEIVGLLGPNGAGKTTAVSIMSTLLSPRQGRLRIFGCDALARPGLVRPLLGTVPQDIALYPSLTARENLTYFASLQGLGGRELARRVDEALSFTNLADHAQRRAGTFSGGMQRRLNLSAGLVHGPRFVFLDEPTAGVDTQSRNLIMERLLALKADGVTMLYTTHVMEEAQRLCDRVIIMDHGVAVAQGAPGALLSEHGCADLGELYLALTGRALRDG